MRKTLAIAIAATIGLTGVVSAEAAPPRAPKPRATLEQVRAQALTDMQTGDIQTVDRRRWRGGRGWGGGRHYGGRRHFSSRRYYGGRRHYGGRRYYGRRYYGRRYYRDRDYGGYAAAGIAGLAAGALIAGAANGRSYSRGDSYCAQRFRSYNPRTGTYTGYDGRQRACP
ncbi:BA14K family protein [Methylopila sp. 73B]|uniref:BA14K family protein n=1 Tax=Methylopila sp. 73B TaxID=1120792 RepID=UPI00037EF65B|nr:BA14K family protein [Methylopila sp. 73B]